ncbi:MAG: APC family permease [Cyanobium sp. LacPavin_0920_WC12_MAG_63_22]|nr:APC family permease [Cyanobium sp. LacPavin_0920_WC12_MAG_63_22]
MLRRCLGPVAVTAQAVGTVGLTLTAVFNIPEAMRSAGSATWISYGLALVVVLLVGETLVLFRGLPGSPNGIAGYVGAGLGARLGALASWALLLGYGATLLGCLVFFGLFLEQLAQHLGLPLPRLLAYLLGALGCLELARRDVQLSTRTMLVTESVSALIILSLTAAVLWKGWGAPDLAAINPLRDTPAQVRSGLMVAVLSFIGFESAANLGSEALQPERAIPRSIRIAVLVAGVLFVVWGAFLPEGLAWLPAATRQGLDPLSALADHLGIPGAGLWIKLGALLCLFGTCIGALTALARLLFGLAEQRLLPAPLARVHPRFGTPSRALLTLGLPLVAGGALVVQRNLTINQIFGLFGGFTVLGFLLVYGLVAFSSLCVALPGNTRSRQLVVGGACLVAVSAMAVAYLSGAVGQQNAMLLTFVGLLLLGALRAWSVPLQPERLR